MTIDNFHAPSTSMDTRSERAERAVKAFRAMQHGLSGYARAITGRKDVRVELAEGVPRTDGTKIFFKPPIALGDLTPHQRSDCERRDRATGQQLCPACKTREEVLITIYHEIAHIVYGTFQTPTDEMKRKALERAIEEAPGRYAQQIKDSWDRVPSYKKDDYLNLSSLISPFLPTLVNVLEDARVDEGMFKARRGTRVMFDAYTQSIFNSGVEEDDGTFSRWSDKPLNSQVVIGVFVLACGYKYEGWFHADVEAALADKRLRELVARVDTLRSAEGTYNLAFPILARLRELGFCKLPEEEPEPEQEPEPEDDENSSESGDGQDADDETEDSEPEASDEAGDDEAGDQSDGEGGSDSGDGPSDSEGDQDAPSAGGGVPDDEADAGDQDGSGSAESGERDTEPSDDSCDAGAGESEPDEGAAGDPTEEEAGSDSPSDGDGSVSGREALDGDDDLDGYDDELIDTGADEGKGGTKTDHRPEYGTPEQALEDVQVFSKHDAIHGDADAPTSTEAADDDALDRAIIQGQYFETPSQKITGVREHKYGVPTLDKKGQNISSAWEDSYGMDDYYRSQLKRLGIDASDEISESILGPALLEMRRTFADNQRAAHERHLRSGKINQRVLGKRAWAGDDRLFQKKRLPGKKSYAVILGIDISGSTVGLNLALAKRAARAQAELCARAGIDFAIYAHTASGDYHEFYLDVYEIKSFDQPWNDSVKEAFDAICSSSENLDGHTIEYYRKLIERHPATDKIILYYSDGKMPAANHDEELEILQREIAYCKAHQITLLGVGIRTDSPRRHGLDTVQVDDDSDISNVVRHLQTSLLHHR